MRYLAVPVMMGMILVNAYIGWRFWRRFFRFFPHPKRVLGLEIGILSFLTVIFWIPRFIGGVLPIWLEQPLYFLGGYWMCADLYLMLLILAADVVWLCRRRHGAWSARLCKIIYGSILGVSLALSTLGIFQANRIQITQYQLQVQAPEAQTARMRIALISDIHLGTIWGADRAKQIVQKINDLEPDLVLISGDLLDAGVDSLYEKEEIAEAFQALSARCGVYACLGNHDSGFGVHCKPEETMRFLASCGIQVLADEAVEVEDQLLLAGRVDPTIQQERKTAAEIVKGDTELPVIMLDHQPPMRWQDAWQEAEKAGVDLVLSGHTHNGQIFPGSLLLRLISTCSYGYWKGQKMQAVVTSGVGTWGPSTRVGTRSEIVLIELEMQPELTEKS